MEWRNWMNQQINTPMMMDDDDTSYRNVKLACSPPIICRRTSDPDRSSD